MYYPALFDVKRTDIYRPDNSWTALAGMTHKGCGLNVLSYYGLMPQYEAREAAVCLPILGTSVFKVVDFIVYYMRLWDAGWWNEAMMNNSPPDRFKTFIVKRFDLSVGLQVLANFINAIDIPQRQNKFIFFKLYHEALRGTTRELSHVGHIVSYMLIGGAVVYIDPQMGKHQQIDFRFNAEALNSLYGQHDYYKFVDIVYTEFNERAFLGFNERTFRGFVDGAGVVIPRPLEMTYGGRRRRRHANRVTKRRSSPPVKRPYPAH